MTPERYRRIGDVYHAARKLELTERSSFLNEACAEDLILREEVESLLASDLEAGDFILSPALEIMAAALAQYQEAKLVGERFSHYRILSLLGAGGMGDVYLAQDLKLQRKVALKLLPAAFANDADRVLR